LILQEFENTSALDIALADDVSTYLKERIEQHGSASLVVSGGRTPLGFFHRLSQRSLDWSQVTVTLADERWVDSDHSDSNEKLVRENLLINNASQAQFLALKNSAKSATDGCQELEKILSTMGPFSAVILGMGDDGHTASLFPGTSTLATGLDMYSGLNCVAVTPIDAPHERMSLTLPRLLNTDFLAVHISGLSKHKVLQQARAGTSVTELPIRAILQQDIRPVTVFWSA
jgi:6-phosphogluconolactonase